MRILLLLTLLYLSVSVMAQDTLFIQCANDCTSVGECQDFQYNIITNNSTCPDNNNGTAQIQLLSGFVAPATFLWSNGATTASITDLRPANYMLRVIDADGCQERIMVSITGEDNCCAIGATCDDGNPCTDNDVYDADCNCIGTPTGNNVGDTCDDGNDCTINDVIQSDCETCIGTPVDCSNNSQTTAISCDDGDPCTDNDQEIRLICDNTVCQPCVGTLDPNCCTNPITATITPNNPTCATASDGSIGISNITGGTGTYFVSWNGGGGFTGSNIPNGTYTITITSDNCTYSETITLNATNSCMMMSCTVGDACDDNNPCTTGETYDSDCNCTGGTVLDCSNDTSVQPCDDGLACTINDQETIRNCDNSICIPCAGTFSATACDDGNPNTYNDTYQNDGNCGCIGTPCDPAPALTKNDVSCNGESTGSITIPTGYTTTNNTTSLSAGSYIIDLVETATGCNYSVTVVINEPLPLSLAFDEIQANVLGGTAPYTYDWSDGSNTNNLPTSVGNYTLTVTDDNGCTIEGSYQVQLDCSNLEASITKTDVTCFGFADGTMDLSVSGGYPPYNYAWSNGATTQDINGLGIGQYTVNISDSENCQFVITLPITQPTALFGRFGTFNSGTLVGVGSPSGGVEPYTFNWSLPNGGNDSGQFANFVGDGLYVATMTDANGCTTEILGNTTCDITADVSQPFTACGVVETGTIEATNITGGNGTYICTWNDIGVASCSRTNLTCGSYTVVISDSDGCYSVPYIRSIDACDCATICDDMAVNCTQTATTVNANPSGGGGNYSYQWSNGSTNPAIPQPNCTTDYSVTVTSLSGCVATCSITANGIGVGNACDDGDPCTVGSTLDANCNCVGGTVVDTDSDGTPDCTDCAPNNNSLPAPQGTPCNDGNPNTNNDVIQADGCTCIGQGCPNISFTVDALNPNCNPNNGGSTMNGQLYVSASNGTAPYSYTWSDGGSGGANGNERDGLASGNYTVTATDANGCTASQTFNVGFADELILSFSSTNPNCPDNNDGAIDLTVLGGFSFDGTTFDRSYSWSNGATTEDLAGLTGGTYTVTVTDELLLCTEQITITLTNTDCGDPCNTSVSLSATSETCTGDADGAATANPSGGVAPYSYVWSNGATTQTISNIAGTQSYGVTVTDNEGCTAASSVFVPTINDVLVCDPCSIFDVFVLAQSPSCNGDNGVATAFVDGGNPPYNYNWSNGTTNNFATYSAGTYSVTVTDSSSPQCESITSFTVSEPSALSVTYDFNDILCPPNADGWIDISVSGGIFPYTYSWSDGSTNEDLIGIGAEGTYTVTVTDGNNCTATISQFIADPPAFTGELQYIEPTCQEQGDGLIDAVINGGTPPYRYIWSHDPSETSSTVSVFAGRVYSVSVIDANGCPSVPFTRVLPSLPSCCPTLTMETTNLDNPTCQGASDGRIVNLTPRSNGAPNLPYYYQWSDGLATNQNDRFNLSAGTYTVTVTEGESGCTETFSWTLSDPTNTCADVCADNPMVISGNVTDASIGQNNGSIQLTFSGGNDQPTPNYTYAWSNGATTKDITNIGYGQYFVTVTDEQNCTATADFGVCGASVNFAVSKSDVSCNGAIDGVINSVEIQTSLPTLIEPVTYSFNGGITSLPAFGLSVGTYTATATDGLGCTYTEIITIDEPSQIAINTSIVDDICQSNDGEVTVTATGGTPNYSYRIDGAIDFVNDDGIFTGIPDDTYLVSVIDANGCEQTLTNQVVGGTSTGQVLTTQILGEVTTDCDQCTGAVSLRIIGGNPPYVAVMTNSDNTTQTQNVANSGDNILFSNLCEQVSNLLITDSENCTRAVSFTIEAQCDEPLQGQIQCPQLSPTIQLRAVPTTGVAPYSYQWSSGETTQTIDTGVDCPNSGQTYTVTITDSTGSTTTLSRNNSTCCL